MLGGRVLCRGKKPSEGDNGKDKAEHVTSSGGKANAGELAGPLGKFCEMLHGTGHPVQTIRFSSLPAQPHVGASWDVVKPGLHLLASARQRL
jgi:hypothetical protein